MLKAQNGIGYMGPGLAAGGLTTLGVRQFATPAFAARYAAGRLGIAGASGGVAAAGQSYLRSEALIQAAEAAGDRERADHIRRYRDVHALLTAGLSMATERFSPLQRLAPGSGGAGLKGGLIDLTKEAAEGPINNTLQGTLVDPLIGEHPDVLSEAPSDFLSGLMIAGGMKSMQAGIGMVPDKQKKLVLRDQTGAEKTALSLVDTSEAEIRETLSKLARPEDILVVEDDAILQMKRQEASAANPGPDPATLSVAGDGNDPAIQAFILKALNAGQLPKPLKRDRDVKEGWQQFKQLIGRVIKTPVGLVVRIKPGHFGSLVSGSVGERQKGKVDIYKNAAEFRAALERGEVDILPGFQSERAANLESVPLILGDPDVILRPKSEPFKLVFARGQKAGRDDARLIFTVYDTQTGEMGLLSQHPREINSTFLAKHDLIYLRKKK